jgi:hypothetical protein
MKGSSVCYPESQASGTARRTGRLRTGRSKTEIRICRWRPRRSPGDAANLADRAAGRIAACATAIAAGTGATEQRLTRLITVRAGLADHAASPAIARIVERVHAPSLAALEFVPARGIARALVASRAAVRRISVRAAATASHSNSAAAATCRSLRPTIAVTPLGVSSARARAAAADGIDRRVGSIHRRFRQRASAPWHCQKNGQAPKEPQDSAHPSLLDICIVLFSGRCAAPDHRCLFQRSPTPALA